MRLSPPFLCLPFPRAQSRSKSDCTTPRKKYTGTLGWWLRMMTHWWFKKLTSENLSGDTILTNKVSKTQMTKIRVSIKSFPIFRRLVKADLQTQPFLNWLNSKLLLGPIKKLGLRLKISPGLNFPIESLNLRRFATLFQRKWSILDKNIQKYFFVKYRKF